MAVFATTKAANPDAKRVDFGLAYKIALWKADSQKRGINPGSNQDAVDLSLSSLSDSEDGSGEDDQQGGHSGNGWVDVFADTGEHLARQGHLVRTGDEQGHHHFVK